MKVEFWRKAVAATLTAALLSVAAIAQEGASEEVEVTGDKPAVEKVEPAVKDGKPVKPQIVDRDPFVNTILSGEVNNMDDLRPTERTRRASVTAAASRPEAEGEAVAASKTAAAEDEDIEEIEVPAPEVTITGIVASGGGRMAIVNAGASSHIIRQGQKMADYSVTSITDNSVTFSYMGKSFEIPLIDEFGNPRE